jgi:hypothetical protein
VAHPACCPDPETCTLAYRDHLVGFGLSASAVPSRAVHRTPGQPDEPATETAAREKRLVRDLAAYKSLRKQGYRPRSVRGADRLAAVAVSDAQVNGKAP